MESYIKFEKLTQLAKKHRLFYLNSLEKIIFQKWPKIPQKDALWTPKTSSESSKALWNRLNCSAESSKTLRNAYININ